MASFSRRTVLALGTGALFAQPPPRRFVIDSHQHYQNAPDYFDRLVRVYKPRNAMACVNAFMRDFAVVRKAASQFPDVVIPYGRVNLDDPAAYREIETFAGAGFKGVKMHSPVNNWDDPRYFPLYERLQRHKLVALFHTGIGSHSESVQFTSMARMRPSYLDTLTRAFPELYIQGAHLGNPWYDEAAEAARWGPRLYFDVTGSTLIKKANSLAEFKNYLWWEGKTEHSSPHAVYAFEKLVFGTDEVPENLDTVMGRHEAMLNDCKVPEESRKKVYGLTMAKILGIQPRT
jgi:predicted TIM-barrel fold metal-dependent hydrolase